MTDPIQTTSTEPTDVSNLHGVPSLPRSGRAQVRELLTGPLAALRRPRGVTAADHARDLDRLADKLAYMTPQALAGLAEVALRNAGAGPVPVCPAPAIIRSWAYALQCPPPRDSDYAASLIRSAMGRQAMDEGWVVPLLRVARRLGPPPQSYIIAKLKDEAEDDLRRRRDIQILIECGQAGSDSRAWLSRWHSDLAECRAILDAVASGPDGQPDDARGAA